MLENFTLSPRNLEERPYTLLTAAFSHKDLGHLCSNMYSLNAFGPLMINALGTPLFVSLYFGAAVFSSLVYLVLEKIAVQRDRWRRNIAYGLGASGAISGMIVAFATLWPKGTIIFLGIVPVSAWLYVAGYLAYEAYKEYNRDQRTYKVGHSAHLGGALYGGLFYLFLRNYHFIDDIYFNMYRYYTSIL
ncbi:hypothetical protein DFA_08109 [Cavenderia fasciculata]|uniref:Peptidase S54 rhomboid domain-containing protein n=1 Tax=Cavenderia fasciculata TaxID=261658 RepID=F4Q568_CACFS|nr:uncharacterized protein DFA_08109 [Cavenderia fasciculata]EGG17127.1 hypothetical protein DFA_08109 [Cavenderia fasciculata]|eukprot:XP_004355611.1 hypothetical protein DFA_08109 [Cavenderia fasciculata]